MDEGGPLVVEVTDTKEPVVLGIYSRNDGCNVEVPSVYTRLSSHYAWINGVAGAQPADCFASGPVPTETPEEPTEEATEEETESVTDEVPTESATDEVPTESATDEVSSDEPGMEARENWWGNSCSTMKEAEIAFTTRKASVPSKA